MRGPSQSRRFTPLADLLRGFFRIRQTRALGIETAPEDRGNVTALITGFEHHADNRAPLFALQLTNCQSAEEAWKDAARGLQDRHTELRAAGAPVGAMPALPSGKQPAANASVLLADLAAAIEAPAQGVLVSLDLRGPVDPALLEQLATMVRSAELDAVRFVVMAAPSAKLEAWSRKLGEDDAWFFAVEPAADRAPPHAAEALATEETLGPGFRGAWPTTKPPPRPRRAISATDRPAPQPALAGQEPLEPEVGGPASPDAPTTPELDEQVLSLVIRRAATAMQQGKGPEALRTQTHARELCIEAGEHVRAVEMEMMLGGYLMQLEQPRLAAQTFDRASDTAFEHQAYVHAGRAQLACGQAHEADDDDIAALRAYRRGIETGKGVANAPAIAFEAYRNAGEIALATGLDVECIGLWADAVAYAETLERSQLRGTPIKAIAKRLSALLTRHRRYSQAREIDRLAETF